MIRFDNFAPQYRSIKEEVDAAIQRVLDSGWFILGRELEAFENEFAAYVGVPHAVGVANGTEAIALALMALGIGRGDEVIVPALTAFPTVTGVLQAGAKPVAADILPDSGLLDVDDAGRRITARTRAIVPVHLYGQSADMGAVRELAQAHGLKVVEDCAQSVGATYRKRRTGSLGDCGAFSFYPTKNLGAYGDGGAVTTRDEETFRRLLRLRNYGQSDRYRHAEFGINSRLDEMQAALLRTKLTHLERWNRRRRLLAARYRERMIDVAWMKEQAYGEAVYHLFAIRHPLRDRLLEYLREHEVQALIHYPLPVHRQPAFPGRRLRLAAAEAFAAEVLSIPLYPELEEPDQDRVIELIHAFRD